MTQLAPTHRAKVEGMRERAADPDVWFSPSEVLELINIIDYLNAKLQQSTLTIASLAEEVRKLTVSTTQPGDKQHG